MKSEDVKFTKTVKDEDGNSEQTSGIVSFNFPETIEEAVNTWGEEVCLTNMLRNVTISVQRVARSADSLDAAQEAVNKFVPGVTSRSTGPSKAGVYRELDGLGEEDIAALLEQAKALKAARAEG